MKRLIPLLFLSLAAPFVWAAQTQAPAGPTIEERLSRLERVMNSQALVNMQLRIDQMQNEIQSLRGQVEDMGHQLDEVKSHQRDLYQDVDRRLLNLERGGTQNPSSNASGASSNTAGNVSDAGDSALPSMAEQNAYQKGINLLKQFRYDQAALAFAAYLKKYPKGRYASAARFWQADSYYSNKEYTKAIQHYSLLLKEAPDSPKAAQALLKIGYSQAELKHWKYSRSSMQQVIKLYPKSTEADLAKHYLQRLKQQGH